MTASHIHPGRFVYENILKKRRISVTEAAKRLGMSRVNLSNFLNGKIAATPKMATKIEAVFGLSANRLLAMQSALETEEQRSVVETRPYISPFPVITATDLEHWADNESSRTEFPVLVRRLIHATCRNITACDFPGYDNGSRPGWDGQLTLDSGNEWVPSGKSVWELGTGKDASKKLRKDFKKRNADPACQSPSDTTFVFASLRNWPSKSRDRCRQDLQAQSRWKDICLLDASRLEQWLERSPEARFWLAKRLGKSTHGVRTLEDCWQTWADATDPVMTSAVFDEPVASFRPQIQDFLTTAGAGTLTIAAPPDEGLAFLYCALSAADLLPYRDRLLVFSDVSALADFARPGANFITVTNSRPVAKACQSLCSQFKTIAICLPTDLASPNITLGPLSPTAFEAVCRTLWPSASIASDSLQGRTNALARQTGRSLTVLHRHLAVNAVFRSPDWCTNISQIPALFAFASLGQWSSHRPLDRKLLKELSLTSDDLTWEQAFLALAQENESPVWSNGSRQGVYCKADVLFSIGRRLTISSLEAFYEVIDCTLTQLDPIDHPASAVWQRFGLGPVRDEQFSHLRRQLADTFALLAVHGPDLTQQLTFDFAHQSATLIRKWLSPFTIEKLETFSGELADLAEAAPDVFFSILWSDLKTGDRSALRTVLLSPTVEPRNSLLAALARLAWLPENFSPVANLLSNVLNAASEHGDAVLSVLHSLFRLQGAQTHAPQDRRQAVFDHLAKTMPHAARLIARRALTRFYNQTVRLAPQPHWRNQAQPVSAKAVSAEAMRDYQNFLFENLLSLSQSNAANLRELLQMSSNLSLSQQLTLLHQLDVWIKTAPSEKDKAALREVLRNLPELVPTADPLQQEIAKKRQAVFSSLIPLSAVSRHEWLFQRAWVKLHPHQSDAVLGRTTLQELEARRKDALTDILHAEGLDGLLRLADLQETQPVIGRLCASLLSGNQWQKLVLAVVQAPQGLRYEKLLAGALVERREPPHLLAVLSLLSDREKLKLFLLLPYDGTTWDFLEQHAPHLVQTYWERVSPPLLTDVSAARKSAVELMNVHRPQTALQSMNDLISDVSAPLLRDLLFHVVTQSEEQEAPLAQETIQDAICRVRQDADVSFADKVKLEFLYIDALRTFDKTQPSKIPELERYIAENPSFYVQRIASVFQRQDGSDEPPALRKKPPFAANSRLLLEDLRELPFASDASLTPEVRRQKLIHWLDDVRAKCKALGRETVGDHFLGRLIALHTLSADTLEPNDTACQAMELIATEAFFAGAIEATKNSHGMAVRSRTDRGAAERTLALQYENLEDSLLADFPQVALQYLRPLKDFYRREARRQDERSLVPPLALV